MKKFFIGKVLPIVLIVLFCNQSVAYAAANVYSPSGNTASRYNAEKAPSATKQESTSVSTRDAATKSDTKNNSISNSLSQDTTKNNPVSDSLIQDNSGKASATNSKQKVEEKNNLNSATASASKPETIQRIKGLNEQPFDNVTVLIDSYTIEDESNSNFVLTLSVKNTSYTEIAGNVYVSVSQDQNLIAPANGSSSIAYIGQLVQQETQTCKLRLKNLSNTSLSNIVCNIKVSYSDAYSTHNEIFQQISLATSMDCALNIKKIDVNTDISIDQPVRIGVSLANISSTRISDISMHVSGTNMKNQTKKIGILEKGSSNNTDCYLNIAKKGKQNLNVYFSYKDNDGNEYKTIPQSFTINVSDKKNATDYSESMNKLNGINFTISGICLIIAALLGLFSLKKIKGKKGV